MLLAMLLVQKYSDRAYLQSNNGMQVHMLLETVS